LKVRPLAIASPTLFIRSGDSAERRKLDGVLEWRLSAESRYAELRNGGRLQRPCGMVAVRQHLEGKARPAIAHGRQDKERRKAQYSNDKAVLLISIVPFIFGMTLVPKAIHSLATFGRAPLNTKVGARPLSPKSSAPVLIA